MFSCRRNDAEEALYSHIFYGTATNSPVRCAFWGSDKCGTSVPHHSFYLPLGSFHLHAINPYQGVDWANLDTTTAFVLLYRYWTSIDTILQVHNSSENFAKGDKAI